MSGRDSLPTRRSAETFDFRMAIERGANPVDFTATVGRHPDGRIGEIFLNFRKLGTAVDASACDAAIAVSLALQHGVPLETLRRSMKRNEDGSPSSPIGMTLDLVASAEAGTAAAEASA